MDSDPRPVLARLSCPVLAFYGESDEWMPIEESIAAWHAAKEHGTLSDFTVVRLAGTDHLPAVGGTADSRAISTGYTDTHADWVPPSTCCRRKGRGILTRVGRVGGDVCPYWPGRSSGSVLEVRRRSRMLVGVIAAAGLVVGCGGGPSAEELASVDFSPSSTDEWTVSTPEDHGLDADAVAELYWRADRLESIHSLLVLKDGQLVAEKYWRLGRPDYQQNVQSVTKSYTGALVALAIEEGCLPSVDEPMMTYFPEHARRLQDPRKNDITIEQLLQMRAGYPWEESYPEGVELLYSGFRSSSLVVVPLVRDPGTGHDYSNLSSHLLATIVSRACEQDLMDFATEHLFDPLGTTVEEWTVDWDGSRLGYTELFVSAMDMARFGQMYLDGGQVDGEQVVPAEWIEESWTPYTEGAWYYKVGDNFDRTAYGYQWWIIDAGPHTYYLAWGHGGQQIAVLPELDMVVVVTADPLYGQFGDQPWGLEKANLNLVADFIAGLPSA